MAKKNDTTRVQCELPARAYQRLCDLKEATEAPSYSHVTCTALRVYELLMSLNEEGSEFTIKKADGTTERVIFLG